MFHHCAAICPETERWLLSEVEVSRSRCFQHPTFKILHLTLNIQHLTSKIRHPTFKIKHLTFNECHKSNKIYCRRKKYLAGSFKNCGKMCPREKKTVFTDKTKHLTKESRLPCTKKHLFAIKKLLFAIKNYLLLQKKRTPNPTKPILCTAKCIPDVSLHVPAKKNKAFSTKKHQ